MKEVCFVANPRQGTRYDSMCVESVNCGERRCRGIVREAVVGEIIVGEVVVGIVEGAGGVVVEVVVTGDVVGVEYSVVIV